MYFKILKEDLIHHGDAYHEGLNIGPKLFEQTPDYVGGFAFTDEKYILALGCHGTKIAEVIVPDGEEIVKTGNYYKAHQIILSKIRNLWTVETFKWLYRCGVDICTYGELILN